MWQITWILSLLPSWFWPTLLIIGVGAIIAAWLLGVIPFVKTYKLPLQVGGVIAVVMSVWFLGAASNEEKWRNEIAEMQKKVDEANAQAAVTTRNIETKVEVQTKVIREKGKDIVKYVDRLVDREVIKEIQGPERVRREEIIKYIENCPVPKEIIDLHNAATEMNKATEAKK
jgi:hypothetical protein